MKTIINEKETGLNVPKKRHPVYEQLGAPSLVYRHEPSYSSSYDVAAASSWKSRTSKSKASAIHATWQSMNRAKTRWNYHLDQHTVRSVNVTDKPAETQTRKFDKINPRQNSAKFADKRAKSFTKTYDEKMNMDAEFDTSKDPDQRKRRCDPAIQMDRLAMLFEDELDPRGPHFLTKDYTTFDHPYISATFEKKTAEFQPYLTDFRFVNSRQFGDDRRNSADPCYLTNFGVKALEAAAEGVDDYLNSNGSSLENNPPRNYGNCLVCVPCPCPPCALQEIGQRSLCLLHPVGELLDQICVSNLILPKDKENGSRVMTEESWSTYTYKKKGQFRKEIARKAPSTLDLDDTIVEIKQCGSWEGDYPEGIFVVRTTVHVSVLKVTPQMVKCSTTLRLKRNDFGDSCCWGNYRVEEKSRFDLRSLSRASPSYRPLSLACHPKYGNIFTPSKFAFVSHSDQEFNVVHSVTGGTETRIQKHTISCLASISIVDYTTTNPMCLWSAARSYVRPALAPDIWNKQPYFDRGTSLYTIDLRSNSAVFQWSPSAKEFVTEGVFSIRGLLTDWQKEQVVWVSSTSAGKVWEIDGRMPCQAVNVWSLTSSCDEPGTNLPANGLFGEGVIFSQPAQGYYGSGRNSPPILSVDKTPGAFGLHLYQRPNNRPRFQTQSVECINTPGIQFMEKTSIATSSVFALPDVSDRVFACGLSTARLPISRLFTPDEIEKFGHLDPDAHTLCALTLTNKGDVYTHTLVESSGDASHAFQYVDLPIGTKAIAIPDEIDGKECDKLCSTQLKPSMGMNLKLSLGNKYPIPGSTFVPPPPKEPLQYHDQRDFLQPVNTYLSDYDKFIGSHVVYPKENMLKVGRVGLAEESSRYSRPLEIPLAYAQTAQKYMEDYSDRFRTTTVDMKAEDRGNSFDESGDEEDPSAQKSDLSRNVLASSMQLWDDLDQLKEEVESEEEDDAKVIKSDDESDANGQHRSDEDDNYDDD